MVRLGRAGWNGARAGGDFLLRPTRLQLSLRYHVAVVEIDEKTGATEIVRYTGVNDVGFMGNPKVVEGQMHGSIALGSVLP